MVKTCKNIGMIKRGEEQEGRRNAGEKIGEKKRDHMEEDENMDTDELEETRRGLYVVFLESAPTHHNLSSPW